MKKRIKQLPPTYQEFLRYFFWGLIATGINIGLYETLLAILPIHYLIINFIVWLITVLFGYYTNRRFVFKRPAKSMTATIKEAGSFISFRIISGFADSFTMWLCFSLLGIPEIVAKLLANLVASLLNYFTSKLIVFKRGNRTIEDIQADLEQLSDTISKR